MFHIKLGVLIDLLNFKIMLLVGSVLIVVLVATSTAYEHHDDLDCTITEFSQVKHVTKKCKDIIIKDLVVPGGTTLKLSLKHGSTLEFQGKTSFKYFNWKGPLLKISGDHVHIRGAEGHVLHGDGQLYWDGLGAKGVVKPKFIALSLNNSVIENINVKNCPVHCVSVSNSNNVIMSKWDIDVSEGNKNNFTGHNTDGFDLSSNNITIKDSVVRNQDDCVVVNRGSDFIVSNVSCYGGHGLSISVGFSDDDFERNSVHNVLFENCLVDTSPNGIHVKTHSDSGPGIVDNVVYRNIKLNNINNFAINVQQDYSDGEATGTPGTNIPIVGLVLENIEGHMESLNDSPTLANYILCGDKACSKWEFKNIKITGAQNKSFCNFVPDGYVC
ncbi:unnamed protein product [Psylliodes chrysocephalus]|uniref:endo-polygalacturonase n=1 Tax=Psylliodes chrysocephalus TaxID=3402493 RepID=A0A9P0DF86_9CUCU|nr:unnamed protein product [Psylliodes chrysocephala]